MSCAALSSGTTQWFIKVLDPGFFLPLFRLQGVVPCVAKDATSGVALSLARSPARRKRAFFLFCLLADPMLSVPTSSALVSHIPVCAGNDSDICSPDVCAPRNSVLPSMRSSLTLWYGPSPTESVHRCPSSSVLLRLFCISQRSRRNAP